ncbi:U3 small nucleolar ribonucleoprotein protein LCP5 [Wickerhamomyces ciferrii]|uniref:U3 small nucleolar ribonucleoprotein protein LCP5 n=1 Tax=Wickerhamomyces ciferrii (strain ATCC 14091 / BCRC 22168 / CBS 111 / JCM 3599 / NBRC 0793 / NRRL Y-1031 F-60-10) TaxID=1206466 RepID=K0KNB1_WICCF|nr:U3 small nucleolar ribonucleoprotein LCP5 [Wickerhamomyces ciferrii]CCH43677.1 U3 small nucleolar ribonucleoprotein protein LCP5 [Wickerhamomyces ciferrii]
MSQSLDDIIKSIASSVDATNDSISNLHKKVESPELPELVSDLLQKTNQNLPEGVSLLDLKNNAILSYLNNLVLIILARIEASKTNDAKDINELKSKAIKGSVTQRVVLERAIKNLEKKLQYQLEKMVRNYNKMEKDSSEQNISKKLEAKQHEESGSEEDSEEEDSEDEDELNYRPDASSLVKSMQKDQKTKAKEAKSKGDKTEKYKPPKIAAALPPSEFKETGRGGKSGSTKMQSMEEYLLENGDAPMVENSIGSTILDHGRGGMKTMKDRQREAEIQKYEESNFTRLPNNVSKKDKRQKRKQEADTFFGEDWGIFNNSKNDLGTSRRAKPKSAWDRAKKRRTD